MRRLAGFIVLLSAVVVIGCGGGGGGGDDDDDIDAGDIPTGSRFINHQSTDLALIPPAAIDQAKDSLHIVYQHTSHGSQLITGMDGLQAFPAFDDRYAWDDDGAAADALDIDDNGIPACSDLSTGDSEDENGDTPWANATRDLLDEPGNSHINVVVWSWCSINGHDADRYLVNMERLIEEYPEVTFVFMTGHAEAPADICSTIFNALGVDSGATINDPLNRPHHLLNGNVISYLYTGATA